MAKRSSPRKDARGTIVPAHNSPRPKAKRRPRETQRDFAKRIIDGFIDERAAMALLRDSALAFVADRCEETAPTDSRFTHSAAGANGVRTFIIPDDADEQVFDALALADTATWLLKQSAEKVPDFWSCIRMARNIGKLETFLGVRPFESPSLIGQKVLRGAGDGARKTNAATREMYEEDHASMRARVDDLMKQGEAFNPATDQVGAEFGVSGRTVRNVYGPNPSPRNRGRSR